MDLQKSGFILYIKSGDIRKMFIPRMPFENFQKTSSYFLNILNLINLINLIYSLFIYFLFI